jgi:cytochrome P450
MSTMSATSPSSYRATLDADPYDFYERVRGLGDVVWDEQMSAWLVLSHVAIRDLMRRDKDLVRHPAHDVTDPTGIAIFGGPRSRFMWEDERSVRHHRWFVQRLSYALVDQWREELIRPIIDRLLDVVVKDGRMDIRTDYGDRFSVRVIAAILGLPWEDDAWIARCKRLLDTKQDYLNALWLGPDEELCELARAAAVEMDGMILPHVETAKGREPRPDDLMALLWKEGPSIMSDWQAGDMVSWVATIFFAGTDTTTHAIANAAYLMMTVDGLQERLSVGGAESVERFAEEVLRLYPSVHFTYRRANVDFELGDRQIRQNDTLFLLDAAANRDPARFDCPHEIDLDRDGLRKHVAFSSGPRSCAGTALARGELQETILRFVDRLPNLRLDPAGESPKLEGFLLRSYAPLPALFDQSSRS